MTALGDHEFKDFRDLPPWRELSQGFRQIPLDIFHVLLHVDSDVLAERIKAEVEKRILRAQQGAA